MESIKPHIRGKHHLIWDWNGTLLNDIEVCVDVISGMLLDHGLAGIDRDQYRSQFRFPIIEYYEGLGFDFEKQPFEIIAKQFVERYNVKVADCRLFDGAHDLLAEISEQGIQQSILSAANQTDLLSFLEQHRIRSHFENVYGLDDHFAAGKVERGMQLIEKINQPKHQIILIGDTDHDLAVGQALGVDVLLLGDGHQCPSRLKPIHNNVVECRYHHYQA